MKCGDFTNKYKYRTSGDRYYSGVRDYFVNMGYSEEGKTGCSLTFSTPGVYSFDEVKIVCQPMAVLSDYTNQRREDVLENTTVTGRTVEGTIDLEKNKILYLSVQDNVAGPFMWMVRKQNIIQEILWEFQFRLRRAIIP